MICQKLFSVFHRLIGVSVMMTVFLLSHNPHYALAYSDEVTNDVAIIIGGRDTNPTDPFQENVRYVTENAYQMFMEHGYAPDDIQYMLADENLGFDSAIDAMPTVSNLETAITEWAVNQDVDTLTLYIMESRCTVVEECYGRIHLDGVNDEIITDADLNQWFAMLEEAVPTVQINIIIDGAYSGAFITDTSISGQNRFVVTSTSEYQQPEASELGSVWSDGFINALGAGVDLNSACYCVSQELDLDIQLPGMETNGDGLSNTRSDFDIASSYYLFPEAEDIPTSVSQKEIYALSSNSLILQIGFALLSILTLSKCVKRDKVEVKSSYPDCIDDIFCELRSD